MGYLIFIIDADESVWTSLKLLVESAGHHGVTFESAEEFLKSGLMKDADCLLLGIRMPGMGGFKFQEHLATSETRIPVIFITGHHRLHGTKGYEIGSHRLLRKPLTIRCFSMQFTVRVKKRLELIEGGIRRDAEKDDQRWDARSIGRREVTGQHDEVKLGD